MALKRLDEEFELKPGTQLLPYMQRLLPSLEGRFQALEASTGKLDLVLEDIRQSALLRMNEILIPATEAIIEVTKLGFLLGPSSTPLTMSLGIHYMYIDEGPQRDSFTPSPYVIVEREDNIDDYAIARVMDYVQETGELVIQITAWHGAAGPHTDWVISSTPGMADSTKLYHDAVAPMHDQVAIDAAQVAADKIEISDALDALIAAGLDVNAFVRRDGTVPFIAQQIGVPPATGANDNHLVTAAWSRARMIEYAGQSVVRSGDTMTGPLILSRAPLSSMEAATKAYVDSGAGAGGSGVFSSMVTIQMVNPTLRMQSAGTQQHRMIEARSSSGLTRWVLSIADNALESGGEAGSNFALMRYNDGGAYLDQPLHINRQTGLMTTKALTANGIVNVVGALNVTGDISAYRTAAPTTGAIYLNQAKTAYHFYDGTTHQFTLGGISCGGSPINGGHLTCLSITTQGHPLTAWGITSNGAVNVTGTTTLNGTLTLVGATSNNIQLNDQSYGITNIRHDAGVVGFMDNFSNWLFYVDDNGNLWSQNYGWLHDYMEGGSGGNYEEQIADLYDSMITGVRWTTAGNVSTLAAPSTYYEPYTGAAVSGFNATSTRVINYFVFRRCQIQRDGVWYNTGTT